MRCVTTLPLPWISLVFGFSIFLLSPSISHPHTLFSYNMFHAVKEKTDRTGVSRVGAKMPEEEPEVFGRQLEKRIATRFRCAMNRSRLERVCWVIFCVRTPLIEKGIIKKIIAERKKKVQRRLAELKLAPRQQWTGIAIPSESRRWGRGRGSERERILNWKKSKTVVNTFFLPSLSFVGFHEGFTILPLLLWC